MSDKQPPPAQSKVLVDLGRTLFGFVSDKAGQPFAISENDPGRLIPFRGRGSVRQALADSYLEQLDKVPSSQALTDALQILEGDARRGDRVVPHLRVARIEGRTLVVDRADPTSRPENRYVLLNDYANPGEFEVTGSPDAVFRSTNLTGPLPVPIGDDLARLRDIINVSDADWPLLVGWMVAALIPDRPVPILWFGGRQGTGKSTAARTLIQIIDPGPAPLQPAPTDPGEWALVASSRWLIGLDNLSRISPWLSDALCRAVTGDGLAKRQLYSDTDLVVVEVQRPIIITAIDAGAIRGDLAERLVPLELEVIATTKRRTERAIDDWLTAHGPAIVGGLYRLTAQVLHVLPEVQLDDRPRMADFAEILAGCDLVNERTGQQGTALDRYLETQGEIFAQVVADDPLGAAIVDLVDRVGRFEGTATELLDALDAARGDKARPRSWPTDAARLGGQMKGLAEALSAVGVDWIGPDRRKKARVHILERRGTGASGASGASVVPVADPVTGTTNRLQPQGIPDPGASGASNSPSLIYGEEEEGGEEKGGSTTGTTGTSSEIPNNDKGNPGASSPTPHWHLLAPLAPVGKGAVDDLDLPF